VERYMAAYDLHDVEGVLALLSEDVEWEAPGAFRLRGREGFAREMANPAYVHPPDITVTRLIAEGDVVVAEGRVRTIAREGGEVHIAFCDVFELESGRIRRLTSYLMELKP
jgi:uncharacterized protein